MALLLNRKLGQSIIIDLNRYARAIALDAAEHVATRGSLTDEALDRLMTRRERKVVVTVTKATTGSAKLAIDADDRIDIARSEISKLHEAISVES